MSLTSSPAAGLTVGVDAQQHQTAVQELRLFNFHANDVREVKSVEPEHAITLLEEVCFYGKATVTANPNYTRCTDVWFKGKCKMPSDYGGYIVDVVYTVQYLSQSGDSGGPWFHNERAFGITYGGCHPTDNQNPTWGAFTPVDFFHRINAGVMARDWLVSGQVLNAGQMLVSEDGRSELVMQHDGNLVLYQNHVPVWASLWLGVPMIPGTLVSMQLDGNFVMWNNGVALWSTSTWGSLGNRIKLQSDGNLVVFTTAWTPLWASNTCCI